TCTALLMHEHPSSTCPLQSLSMPSHASGLGPTAPAHEPHAPDAHDCVPCLHAPTLLPQVRSALSAQEHPSSAVPLQSSSIPLHVSGCGPMLPTQISHAPFTQVCPPCLHAPTLLPHKRTAPFVHWHPSSAVPSQSSSMPLHVSGCEPTP